MSLITSLNRISTGGYTVGGTVPKDTSDGFINGLRFDDEFNPNSYQVDLFPGLSDLIENNIELGDKSSEDKYLTTSIDDWDNDVFDGWGFFYLYDVASQKYYFPILNPINSDDGVLTTQTFVVFGRTFTITHGYPVQGIFKFDISVNDNDSFRFGAYGDMGSDGDQVESALQENYTLNNNELTLYYRKDAENNDNREIMYSYFIPKVISENTGIPTTTNYTNDDYMSMFSKPVTQGLIVYLSKTNDVKNWVLYDIGALSGLASNTYIYNLYLTSIKNNTKQTEDKLYDRFNYKKALTNYKVKI